jgi:lysozyme family protein
VTDRITALIDQAEAVLAQLRLAYADLQASPQVITPAPVSSPSRYKACIPFTLREEGGYSNHPADKGGPTNMGVTLATLGDWRNADVTAEDVKALTQEEAVAIFQANYWLKFRCDQMRAGVDLAVFDFGVNSGGAIKAIQRQLGVTPDGVIGPQTLATMNLFDPPDLVERICDLRMVYLRKLEEWPIFGNGWTARVGRIRMAARAMALGQAVSP